MFARTKSFLRTLLHRARFESELDDEIASHIEERAATLVASGMSREQALRTARVEMGAIEAYKDDCRQARGSLLVTSIVGDVRYSLRTLSQNRGFTAAALLSLALGIGANSAVFAMIDAVMLRSMNVRSPRELFDVVRDSRTRVTDRYSWPLFEKFRDAVGRDRICAFTNVTSAPLIAGESQMVKMQLVSGEFFDLLGAGAAIGRVLHPADNVTVDGHPVAVISYGLWQRRFGGSASVLDRDVVLGGSHFRIIGVAQQGFTGVWMGSPAEVWIPTMMQRAVHYESHYSNNNGDREKPWPLQDRISWLKILARAPVSEQDRVRSELNRVHMAEILPFARDISNAAIREAYLQQRIALSPAATGLSNVREKLQGPLLALMATVCMVLLISCANLANLLLARSAARRREIAVRMSAGANRARLVRQLLTESLLLAFVGGALGLLIANWGQQMFANYVTPDVPVELDARVLTFTLAVATLTAVLFGLAPALRATNVDIGEALKSAARSVHHGSRLNAAKLLVAAQVCLSLLLLAGAGLCLRSFVNLARVDLGFSTQRLISVSIAPRAAGYGPQAWPELYRRYQRHVMEVSGVESATVIAVPLVSASRSSSDGVHISGYQPSPSEAMKVHENWVDENYFDTVAAPILRGRGLSAQDVVGSRKVAVINEALADRYFRGRDPIGQKIGYTEADTEIVGVVRNTRDYDVREAAEPMVYMPSNGSGFAAETILVRVSGTDPRSMIAPVRRAVAAVDSNVPIRGVGTITERIERSLLNERLLTAVTTGFGVLALLLACVGLYGVMSYTVVRRTSELGVRLALGASRGAVLWLVLRECLWLAVIGVVIGLPLAVAGAQVFSRILYEVGGIDALVLGLAAVLSTLVTVIAGYVPAWRASRVNPVVALRYE